MGVKPAEPEPVPMVVATPAAPAQVSWIGNTIMPHPWDKAELGGVCPRCGADWPSRDNCP